MYKKNRNKQLNLTDFNQPMGLKLDPENKWIKKAEMIPWNRIEDKYATLFESTTGTVAKPLRMALGSLMIQKEYDFSDRTLVEQPRTASRESVFSVFHRIAWFPVGSTFRTFTFGRVQKTAVQKISLWISMSSS
jgi:hypothetical protein